MANSWTFGQKMAAGFAAVVLLAILVAGVAAFALRSVVAANQTLLAGNVQRRIAAQDLRIDSERVAASVRGYLLSKEAHFLTSLQNARTEFDAGLERLKQGVAPEGRDLLEAVERANGEHRTARDRVVNMRQGGSTGDAAARVWDDLVVPKRQALDKALEAFLTYEERLMEDATRASAQLASSAVTAVVSFAILAVVLALVAGILLSRTIARQIGLAVGQVQSSSTQLQAVAGQQASGSRQQATAMAEIATTISELLATSRQIAESAQRVAHIAGESAAASRSGQATVERGQESIAAIRRQTDLVVNHMLELGRKSQQIGAVLDIVSELAEQTNILSINATIEAAGAGEGGKRFAAVADEIRKLADRVATSTKDIRALVDEVRSAVNTTVMTTEGGSKAVDAGARQFSEVAGAFQQIAGLVGTLNEAAREIELSTKQQATAVEQVKTAVANVAQASKESEASSGQTLQTASQLAGLSRDLLRLIRPQTEAHPA